jgi:hypothetical protein
MFQLLSLWTQYVEVVYMPETEIHMLSAIQNMEARPEDAGYGFRTQESELKNRINTLFSHKDEGVAGSDVHGAEDEYETVNEGMTTDTTEAPSYAAKRGGSVEESTAENNAASPKDEGEAEGILSSDEEGAQTSASAADKKVKVGDKPIIDKGDHEIRGFGDGTAAARGLFENEKTKEEVENKYSYSEQDVEYFGAKLQSRSDRDLGVMAEDRAKKDDEEQSYVSCKILIYFNLL